MLKMKGRLVLMVVVVWTFGGVKGIVRPGLDQQVTKESQNARGGAWPPPAVFEIPDPVDLLTSALEAVHKDDLDTALSALQKALRVSPNSYEVAMHLGFVYCALGNEAEARKYHERALPSETTPPTHNAVTTAGGPFEVGDTLLESAVRESLSAGSTCVPLPLLYPSALVVQETSEMSWEVGGGAVGGVEADPMQYTRVYFLDRLDGEGSLVVKQTSTLAAAREAFVLLELRYSAGDKDDGSPPCFPMVFGSLVTRRWSACALSNFEGAAPLAERVAEDMVMFNETGMVFDIFDRLLQIVQQMQGAGVTHRSLCASTVVMLAGDVPAIVGFDYAVAQGMAFPVPELPPHFREIYTRPSSMNSREWGLGRAVTPATRLDASGGRRGGVELTENAKRPIEGEVMEWESDIYAVALLLGDTLPLVAAKFQAVLDVMLERWLYMYVYQLELSHSYNCSASDIIVLTVLC